MMGINHSEMGAMRGGWGWALGGEEWIWKCSYAPPLLLPPPHRLKGVCESGVKFRSSETASHFMLRSRCLNEDGVWHRCVIWLFRHHFQILRWCRTNGSWPPQLDSTCCLSNWTIFTNYYCFFVVYDALISVSPLPPARVCLSNLTFRLQRLCGIEK